MKRGWFILFLALPVILPAAAFFGIVALGFSGRMGGPFSPFLAVFYIQMYARPALILWAAILVVVLVARRARKVWATVGTALLVLIALTWDISLGPVVFRDMCRDVAGQKVHRVATGVEGFAFDSRIGQASVELACNEFCVLALRNHQFIEFEVRNRNLSPVPGPGLYRFSPGSAEPPACTGEFFVPTRFTLRNEPAIGVCAKWQAIERYTARYVVRAPAPRSAHPLFQIYQQKAAVIDTADGTALGSYTRLGFNRGWAGLERLVGYEALGLVAEPDTSCPRSGAGMTSHIQRLVKTVLHPDAN